MLFRSVRALRPGDKGVDGERPGLAMQLQLEEDGEQVPYPLLHLCFVHWALRHCVNLKYFSGGPHAHTRAVVIRSANPVRASRNLEISPEAVRPLDQIGECACRFKLLSVDSVRKNPQPGIEAPDGDAVESGHIHGRCCGLRFGWLYDGNGQGSHYDCRKGCLLHDEGQWWLPLLLRHTSFALRNGSSRTRLPVAAKIAFAIAGATGGTPGSDRKSTRLNSSHT